MQNKNIIIEYEKVQRWDGQLPRVTGANETVNVVSDAF